MTPSRADKLREIDANLAAFMKICPELGAFHTGEHALLRHGEVHGFYATALEAQLAGVRAFDDGLFSIQVVTEQPTDLGFYSHAHHPRAA